jgi:hypothetical protein
MGGSSRNGERQEDAIDDPDATNLMAILLAGSNAPPQVEHAFMPPFVRGHTEDELAAVANFVNGFLGNGTASGSSRATTQPGFRVAVPGCSLLFFDQISDG